MTRDSIRDQEGQGDEGDSEKKKQGNQLENAALWGWLECHLYGRVMGVGQKKNTGATSWRGGVQGKNMSTSTCHTDSMVKSSLAGKPFTRLLYLFIHPVIQSRLTEFLYIPGLC